MKKKIVSMLLAMCMIMSITPLTAFAVEDGEDDVTRVNEVTDKILVEEIDPNIQVIVTPVEDDANTPMLLELRRTDTYFEFSGKMNGKVRYYKGNHFSVDLTSSSEGSGNFVLSLVRTDGLFDKTVAKAEIPKNGLSHVEFLNVYKPGNYRFDFKQVGFGAYHQEGKMTIWDWD